VRMASPFDGYQAHCCRTSGADGVARYHLVQLQSGVVLAQAEMGSFQAVYVDAGLALGILLQTVGHCRVTGVFVQHPLRRQAQSSAQPDFVA
jgi:hypothetical protein